MLNQIINKLKLQQGLRGFAGGILNRITGAEKQAVAGVSLTELLVALVMIGILAKMVSPNITFGEGDAADTAATQIQSTLRTLRTLAISNTSAYRMTWSSASSKTLVAQYVNSTDCTSATGWKSAGMFSTAELTLPNKARITSPSSISICFDSQGMASQDLTILIGNTSTNRTRTVQAYIGGAIDAY